MSQSQRCFVCNASLKNSFVPAQRGLPTMCTRCGGSVHGLLERLLAERAQVPIPLLLWCPGCGERHVDEGEFATKVHTTHACQHCGHVWRPAIVPTCGVRFLPGYKNGVKT